jgi:hypothetical protein
MTEAHDNNLTQCLAQVAEIAEGLSAMVDRLEAISETVTGARYGSQTSEPLNRAAKVQLICLIVATEDLPDARNRLRRLIDKRA